MWETDWARAVKPNDGGTAVRAGSAVEFDTIEGVYLLHWREHCVECAPPDCYRSCRLYVKRRDQKCARFRNGIAPNASYQGLFGYGAEIQFRRWGKLESNLTFGIVKPQTARLLASADSRFVRLVNFVAGALETLNPKRRLNGGYAVFRNAVLETASRAASEPYDEFVMEAFNPSGESYNLVLEIFQNEPRFRVSLPIRPGHNLHRLPVQSMNVDLNAREGRISIRPDRDVEAHVIFTWLDFVRYRSFAGAEGVGSLPKREQGQAAPSPAEKVKCVVWDLDNTLWRGILVEDGVEGIQLRPEALKLISRLDERGIVQSIASKNDHDAALDALNRLGLKDYFLYPAINWGPKSEGIRAIATELNLGLDSFAFIDDSPVERAQVKESIPELRVYAETEIAGLSSCPELTVPITVESRQRRLSYVEESQRKAVSQRYVGDLDAFLRSCELQADVFTPENDAHIERCLELLHRSNQLNLTTHRYTEEQLNSLLRDPSCLCLAISCHDRFGDYGIVGFAAVDLKGASPLLIDFVLSCRVAKKKVENAWFRWITEKLKPLSFTSLEAMFIPTKKNKVLLDVLQEAGFCSIEDGRGNSISGSLRLELPFDVVVPGSDIVRIVETGVRPLSKNSTCSPVTL